jgi:hypothetical protein
MLERETGAAYFIEFNSRCTQLGHLRVPGGDLAGVLAARMNGEAPPVETDPIGSDTIAFFPNAFLLNPRNPYLRYGYHDVPWEEPRLFQELMRESWPHRRWVTRVYRLFRPAKRGVEMNFDRDAIDYLGDTISNTDFVTANSD